MSFRPMFELPGEAEPCGNAQRFATYEEAEKSAASRFAVWTMPTGYTVHESDDPVNYKWDDKLGDVPINREPAVMV